MFIFNSLRLFIIFLFPFIILTCDSGGDNPIECVSGIYDCEGTCDGELVEDCAGECNGDAVIDDCGVCDGGDADHAWC